MQKFSWSSEQDGRLVSQYRAGIPIDQIFKTFQPRRSRTSLYRRLQFLDEPAREPGKKRQPSGYYVAIVIYTQAHRLVRQLLGEAREQRCNCKDLAAGTGVSREAINLWNRGGKIKLHNLEAAGRRLGLRLEWTPIG